MSFKDYSDILVRLREEEGLTQEEAADRVGVSRSTWSNWERGVQRPQLRHKLHKKFENYEKYYMQFVRERYGDL